MKVPYLYVNGECFTDNGRKITNIDIQPGKICVYYYRWVDNRMFEGSATYSFDEDIKIEFEDREEHDAKVSRG